MERDELVVLITTVAQTNNEISAAMLAFVEIESSFNVDAIRDEPKIRDASYGLFQILYHTAIDRGFTGNPLQLFNAETNINLGIAQIQWIRKYLLTHLGHDPSWEEIAGAYNAGVGNVCHGFLPTQYINRWKLAFRKWTNSLAASDNSAS